MRKVFAGAAVMAAAVLIVGCVETKQDYTLNPDGSGKVVFELVVADMPFNMGGEGEKPDPEARARTIARQTLEGSGGVDTWTDVSVGRTDDGRIRFKGTAYFKDFSKLKFQMASFEGLSFVKDPKGGMILALEQKDEGKPATPPPTLTPEELAARIKTERDKFQQASVMMQAIMAKLKMDFSFRLPGTLAEVNNFQKQPDGTLRLVVEGAKLLQVMDQLMADDAHVKEIVLAGEGANRGPKMDAAANEKMFGARGPIQARVTGDLKPLFAYEAEMTAAKEKYPAMIQALGLDKAPAPPAISAPPGETPAGAPAAK